MGLNWLAPARLRSALPKFLSRARAAKVVGGVDDVVAQTVRGSVDGQPGGEFSFEDAVWVTSQ